MWLVDAGGQASWDAVHDALLPVLGQDGLVSLHATEGQRPNARNTYTDMFLLRVRPSRAAQFNTMIGTTGQLQLDGFVAEVFPYTHVRSPQHGLPAPSRDLTRCSALLHEESRHAAAGSPPAGRAADLPEIIDIAYTTPSGEARSQPQTRMMRRANWLPPRPCTTDGSAFFATELGQIGLSLRTKLWPNCDPAQGPGTLASPPQIDEEWLDRISELLREELPATTPHSP